MIRIIFSSNIGFVNLPKILSVIKFKVLPELFTTGVYSQSNNGITTRNSTLPNRLPIHCTSVLQGKMFYKMSTTGISYLYIAFMVQSEFIFFLLDYYFHVHII